MNAIALANALTERLPLPDWMSRAGARFLIGRTSDALDQQKGHDRAFAQQMRQRPIAIETAAANQQHYELPEQFFGLILGPQRKYSSCFYSNESTTLAEAEEAALAITAQRASLSDGQRILELGCGWGSLTLWMARRFPQARIEAVSNSASQRDYILRRAALDGLANVSVTTADMNGFDTCERYDRIVSVEMFEHMSNWDMLLRRAASWLKPDGAIFIHVFSHREESYTFDRENPSDWMAQHFFCGGVMPSRKLIRQFDDIVRVEEEWSWDGRHYARTLRDWLARFDDRRADVTPILQSVYGSAHQVWARRWRLFFLGSAELFGYRDGTVWGVSHYLMRPRI